MNSKVYKSCSVPQCVNTSLKTPHKLFVYVPNDKTTRYKWLTLARRDPKAIKLNTGIYFCEDHFDLPNCMDNFMEYHVMGFVSQVRMKPGCMPTKFQCQPDRRKRTSDTTKRPYILKKHRNTIIEEAIKDFEERSISIQHKEVEETSSGTPVVQKELENIALNKHKTPDKSIQVPVTHKLKSRAIQTGIQFTSQMTSPLKPHLESVTTSPIEITRCTTKIKPTTSDRNKFAPEDQSDRNISYIPSITHAGSSPETVSLPPAESTSDCIETQDDKEKEACHILQYTLLKIKRNPHFYIGIPKNCYYLISHIKKISNISDIHILMCLIKIRLNNPFTQIADDFAVNSKYARKIFIKNIPFLASVMRPFIVSLNDASIKNNLPIAFRHNKYYNVSCIIDCLEIEIEKPSKTFDQCLTWSDHNKGNTIKYLIACTPNGLVNYISPGYSGRVTDTCLVETCDFIKCLQSGMYVMADRGFKDVETYLLKHGVKLVRPPSITNGNKLSKTETKETKQISSLRIHIEKVIRRLGEFRMLKPHACNYNTVRVLDDVITIACGLINIQDSLIK